MKLLALLGYPRRNGQTERMTELFLRGARDAGAEIRRVSLPDAGLRQCLGCYSCWTKTPGKCVQKDAMEPLLEQFLASDLVLLASPVYAFSVSSHLKIFMERTLALLSPGAEEGPAGTDLNRWRYPGRGPKRMAGILVAGKKSPRAIQPSVDTLTLYAAEMRMACSGILCRPESSALRFPQAKPMRMKAILAGFERAGTQFVRDGAIAADTLKDVSTPLLSDLPHFVRYSLVFWEHALKVRDECDEAGQAAADDVRILMYEMARCINPSATRDVVARMQFRFPDKGLAYALSIDRGTCTLGEGEVADPDLSITCPASLWSDVIQRRIPGQRLLDHPDVHLKGDLGLLRRLPRFFPPPAE